jgi:Iap family predicted aminopeptidase
MSINYFDNNHILYAIIFKVSEVVDGMKKFYFMIVSVLIISFVFGNALDKDVIIKNLKDTVFELSKDEYEGRLTGAEGNFLAQEFIQKKLSEMGYETKLSEFELKVSKYNKTPLMKYGEKIFDYAYDFDIKIQPGVSYNGEIESDVFILEKEEDLNALPKNSVIFVRNTLFQAISSTPMNMQNLFNPDNNIQGLFIAGDTGFGQFPKMVGVITNAPYQNKGPFLGSVTNKVFDYIKSNKDQKITIKAYGTVEESKSNNIYVKVDNGAEETVVFGAHYDGQGSTPSVYKGAYDNASGVSIVLELARLLKEDAKYNYMFVFFSGEEQYYIGSQNFVKNHDFDVENTYYVNFDSLGVNEELPLSLENILDGDKSLRTKMYVESKKMGINSVMSEVSGGDAQSFKDIGITSVQLIQPSKGIMHTLKDVPENINYDFLYNVTKLVYQYFQK